MIQQFGYIDQEGLHVDDGMYPTIGGRPDLIRMDINDKELVTGEIYLFEWTGKGLFIRRFQGFAGEYILLQADNPDFQIFPPIGFFPSDKIKALGKIVGIDGKIVGINGPVIDVESDGMKLKCVS